MRTELNTGFSRQSAINLSPDRTASIRHYSINKRQFAVGNYRPDTWTNSCIGLNNRRNLSNSQALAKSIGRKCLDTSYTLSPLSCRGSLFTGGRQGCYNGYLLFGYLCVPIINNVIVHDLCPSVSEKFLRRNDSWSIVPLCATASSLSSLGYFEFLGAEAPCSRARRDVKIKSRDRRQLPFIRSDQRSHPRSLRWQAEVFAVKFLFYLSIPVRKSYRRVY